MDPRLRAHHLRLAIPKCLKHDSKSVLPERSNYLKFHTLWTYGLEHCVDMGSVMSKSPQNRSGLKIKPSNQRSDVKRSSIFLYARTSRRWQRRRRRKSTINMRGCSIGTWVGIEAVGLAESWKCLGMRRRLQEYRLRRSDEQGSATRCNGAPPHTPIENKPNKPKQSQSYVGELFFPAVYPTMLLSVVCTNVFICGRRSCSINYEENHNRAISSSRKFCVSN